MERDPRSFVVHSDDARTVRGRLGVMAWSVLEELLAHSSGRAGECVAQVGVRRLAADLRVSKDTVARGLRRLAEAGIVVADQHRTASGAFARGSYRINVPSCFTLADPVVAAPLRRRAAVAVPVVQLSLIDLDSGTS